MKTHLMIMTDPFISPEDIRDLRGLEIALTHWNLRLMDGDRFRLKDIIPNELNHNISEESLNLMGNIRGIEFKKMDSGFVQIGFVYFNK
jgi:hypothetical protein